MKMKYLFLLSLFVIVFISIPATFAEDLDSNQLDISSSDFISDDYNLKLSDNSLYDSQDSDLSTSFSSNLDLSSTESDYIDEDINRGYGDSKDIKGSNNSDSNSNSKFDTKSNFVDNEEVSELDAGNTPILNNPSINSQENIQSPDLDSSFRNLEIDFDNSNTIFLNASYEGSTESGSRENPFKTINSAVNKLLSSSKTNLFIADGLYELKRDLTITKTVNIIGESALNTIISGKNTYEIFFIQGSKVIVNIFNLTFTKGSSYEGPAIYNNGSTLNIVNTIFKDNIAVEKTTYYNTFYACGGAIFNDAGKIKIYNSTFENNGATGEKDAYGGAIYNFLGDMNILNSQFVNNSVISGYGVGGAIFNYGGFLTVFNSSICNNTIYSDYSMGGGIGNWNAHNVYILNSTFVGNVINGVYTISSAIINKGTYFVVENVTMANNLANGTCLENSTILNLNALYKYNNVYDENNVLKDVQSDLLLCLQDQAIVGDAFSQDELLDLPSRYDLRDYNLVTDVHNQGGTGSCWAFSTLAALESYLLKYEGSYYDFSENNLRNLMGYYGANGTDWEDGGNHLMGLAYLLRWNGPVNETQDPFNEYSSRSPTFTNITKHVQDALFIPLRKGYLDNDQIKKAILDYGALYVTIYSDDYFQYRTSYYTERPYFSNHAITLVGWDDNYSASNFAVTPPGDGAFIIKNSWGKTLGDSGYWYISYYDTAFAGFGIDPISAMAFTNVENVTNYKDIYQYDILGNTFESIGYNCNTAWFANQFTSEANNPLSAFGIYTYGSSSYLAEVYVNGALKYIQEGNISSAGYHTIKLDQLVGLAKNDIFKIAVRLTTPDSLFPIAIETKCSGYSSKATAKTGQSLISADGINWYDISKSTSVIFFNEYLRGDYKLNSTNVCLKAYTAYAGNLILEEISNVSLFFKGDTIEITYNLTNIGDYINDINLTLTLDETVQVKNVTYSKGIFDMTSNVWSLSSLANDETATLKIVVLMTENKEVVENLALINTSGFNLGDENYQSLKLYYSGLTRFLSIGNITTLSRSNEEIIITLVDALSRPIAGKEIKIALIGTDNIIKLNTSQNGIVHFALNLTEGNYSYNVSFEGDDGFDACDLVFNVSVNRILTYFVDANLTNVVTLSRSNDTVNFILLDEFSNLVLNKDISLVIMELSQNNTFNTGENDNIAFNLDLLKGNYTFVLSYEGDEVYEPAELEFNVTVNKRDPPLILVGDSEITNTEEFTVCIVDRKFNVLSDKIVSLTLVDSKNRVLVYNITTDECGVARLSGITGGNYTVSGIFANDELYEDASFSSVKLIVHGSITNIDIPSFVKYENGFANVSITLSDYFGGPICGKVIELNINNNFYNLTTDENGLARSKIAVDEGNYLVSAKFKGDLDYLSSNASKEIIVSSSNIITVNHTGDDTKDIQKAIDDAQAGDIIFLGEYNYTNVNCVNITKDIVIMGNNTNISSLKNSDCIFNIVSKAESDINEVIIEDINFIVDNGDTVVLAVAANSSNPLAIDVPAITIVNNIVSAANEDVVVESINILELQSERPILAPTNDIKISQNTLLAGINPFKFEVLSVVNGSEVNISSDINFDKLATVIEYSDMTTTAVDIDTDGAIGQYFIITLKDSDGNALEDKDVQFGFNGKIYNKTTNSEGKAQLQINLKRADIYTFAVSFLGDNQCNGSFAVAKITVIKQKPTIALPNKSYKVSAKIKTLTATFKAASGKAVKGKKITFTVNGKTYTATTDAKGIATVNVSLSTKKTYSFTAKFAGDNTYSAITKNAKLIIN